MDIPFDVLVPKPIGAFFHHRYFRDGQYCEHHEARWLTKNNKTFSVCNDCGKKALFVDVHVAGMNYAPRRRFVKLDI